MTAPITFPPVDAAADPSGKQEVFIALSGSVATLYIVSASGGEPQKVVDLNATFP